VILSAKHVWPNMTTDTLYVKSLPVPRLDMRKNGFETHMTFSTHKQKFPSKKSHFRGTLVQNLHAICVSLSRYDFDVYCK